MTTREFLIAKNKLVMEVTGKVLIPDDQIEDEPKVKLDSSSKYLDSLAHTICPYCVSRIRIGYSYCSSCPMSIAGNECGTANGDTWDSADDGWIEKATNRNKREMQRLILEYNRNDNESFKEKIIRWTKLVEMYIEDKKEEFL